MTQKYEREIEEILRNLDGFVPDEPLLQRASKRARSWFSGIQLPGLPVANWRQYITVQWVMVASIVLIMFGFVMRSFIPMAAGYANLLGFALMVAAILMSVFHIGGPPRPRKWRGQVIDISSHDASWWASFQRRWRLWWRSRD